MAPQASASPMYTEDKAVHLVRVFSAILFSLLLVGWMDIILIRPMKVDALEMAHMDPSEIIAIPFPLKRLNVFVMFPIVIVMVLWLVKAPLKMMSNLLSLTKLIMVIYALFALCGANIVDHYQHSLTAALYVAALASTTWTGKTTSNILEELPFYDYSDLLAASRFYGMVLVGIPFQVLSTLDAGVQMQRWPMPITLGVTYGYVGGTLFGLFLLYAQNKKRDQQRRQ